MEILQRVYRAIMIVNDHYKKNLRLIPPTIFLRRKRVYRKRRRFLKKLHKFKINFNELYRHQMKHQRTSLMINISWNYSLTRNNLYKCSCISWKLTYNLAWNFLLSLPYYYFFYSNLLVCFMLFLQLINYFQKLNRILLSTFNINFKLPRLYCNSYSL